MTTKDQHNEFDKFVQQLEQEAKADPQLAAQLEEGRQWVQDTFYKPKSYVVGFIFNPDHQQVALIRKTHPKEQVGLLNGIGGKIELGESPVGALVREIEEEAGFKTTKDDWLLFHKERHQSGNTLFFYTMKTDEYLPNALKTMTDEKIETFLYSEDIQGRLTVHGAPFTPGGCMYNLSYLLPMALCYMRYPEHRYLEG